MQHFCSSDYLLHNKYALGANEETLNLSEQQSIMSENEV